MVAENPNTPVDILKRLADDENEYVRKYLARNPNTPTDILNKLANDKNESVKKTAKETLNNKKLKEGTKMKSFKQYLKEETIKPLKFNGKKPEIEKVRGSDLKVGDYILSWTVAPKSSSKNDEKSYMQIINKDSNGDWVVVYPSVPNTSHKLSSKSPVYKLKESTWTDYYDKIVDLDLDTKTMSSKYKNRKDLESAAAKKYGWNVQSEPFKTAFDKYFNESAKALKESLSGVSRTSDVIKTLDVFQTNISTKIKSLKDVVNKRNHKEVERLGESILADAKKLDKFLNAVAEDLEYDNIA